MAESLRRLVNIGSFSVLQAKLEQWLDSYYLNTCDQNVNRCVEVLELNAKVQAQLFKLLHLTASEGGTYAGADIIKRRLLPWLSQGFLSTGPGLSTDTSLSLIAESAAKDRELNELQDTYERSLTALEEDLQATRIEADDLKAELEDTRAELEDQKRASVSDKMYTESEVRELRAKLRIAENELVTLRARVGLIEDYERQIARLRGELAVLTGRKERERLYDSGISSGDLRDTLDNYRYLPRPLSPLDPDDVTQRVRQQNLITRFNDMYSQDRLDAMDTLRRYSDDHENNQRIIMAAMQEAFSAAKLAFSQFKSRVRTNLAITHTGPETLEEAVQDYINRNTDMYDLPGMCSDVIRGLNRNFKISLPTPLSYSVIQPFIREACKLAWNMSALAHPLDIALASDAELFDETRYRRSYDSEFTAPLVNHHIWPCLMQGGRPIMKGEAHTRRGASLSAPRRSRSPTRSLSPVRPLSPVLRSLSPSRLRSTSPSRLRSRSPSPRRAGSSMELGSSLSGRSSPVYRSRSPSRSTSRSLAASTALSHYGVKS